MKCLGVCLVCTASKMSGAHISEVENGLKFYTLNLLHSERKIFSGFVSWTLLSHLT